MSEPAPSQAQPAWRWLVRARRRIGRWALVLFAVSPYVVIAAQIPGALRLIRLELDWVEPCAQRLQDVYRKLSRGERVSTVDLACPVTGSHYILRRDMSGLTLLCPGIHRRVTFVWLGFNQATSSPHLPRGMSVHESVLLTVLPGGELVRLPSELVGR